MKNINKILEESFHRELTPEEKALLDEKLKEDKNLSIQKAELQKTYEIMENYTPSFGKGFKNKVLDSVFSEELKTQMVDLFPVFKKLFLGGLAATIALLLSVYLTDGTLNTDAIFGLSDLNSEELLIALLNF